MEPDQFEGLPEQFIAGERVFVWTNNDFGEWAWSVNSPKGIFLHTDPETEEAARQDEPVELAHSHECIHLDPKERDEMIKKGFLQKGVTFVVKKYSAHLLPELARRRRMYSR